MSGGRIDHNRIRVVYKGNRLYGCGVREAKECDIRGIQSLSTRRNILSRLFRQNDQLKISAA